MNDILEQQKISEKSIVSFLSNNCGTMTLKVVSPTRFCTNTTIKSLVEKYCPRDEVTILDVGCGKGCYYQYLTSNNIKGKYLGIDIVNRETWQAKEVNGLDVSYLAYDAQNLRNLEKKFDFIFSIQALEHIQDDMAAVEGILKCLNDKGHFLMTVPSKYSYLLYGSHGLRRYDTKLIQKMCNMHDCQIVEMIKIGGLCTFGLHFILFAIPAVIFKVKVWKLYDKSRYVISLINKLECFSSLIDRKMKLLEGGYAVVLKRRV